jgi:hypothetical protein
MTLAEISCWIGIITGISYWHAIEESFWMGYALFILNWIRLNNTEYDKKHKLTKYIIYGYLTYMITYDIPTYIYRPNANKQKLLTCEAISKNISIWTPSLIWMTGYFTLGSWISLAIS